MLDDVCSAAAGDRSLGDQFPPGATLNDIACAGDKIERSAARAAARRRRDLLLGNRSGSVRGLLLNHVAVADGDGQGSLVVDNDGSLAVAVMVAAITVAAVVGKRWLGWTWRLAANGVPIENPDRKPGSPRNLVIAFWSAA